MAASKDRIYSAPNRPWHQQYPRRHSGAGRIIVALSLLIAVLYFAYRAVSLH